MNYSENFLEIERMVSDLRSQSDIIKSVDSWLTEFRSFVQEAEDQVDWAAITEDFFMQKLTQVILAPHWTIQLLLILTSHWSKL